MHSDPPDTGRCPHLRNAPTSAAPSVLVAAIAARGDRIRIAPQVRARLPRIAGAAASAARRSGIASARDRECDSL